MSNPILKRLTNRNLRQLSPGVTLHYYWLSYFSYHVVFSQVVTVHLHCWCARVFLTWDRERFFRRMGEGLWKKNPDRRSGFSCLKKKMRKTVFVTWLFFSKSCRASGILGADDPFGDVSKSISLFSLFLFWRFSVFAFAKLFNLSKEDNFSQSQQSCR